MNEKCSDIKEALLDIYYEEQPMTEAIKAHIAECPECALYWAEIQKTALSLYRWSSETSDNENVIDFMIQNAFAEAEKRKAGAINWGETGLFILTAITLILLPMIAIFRIDPTYWLYLQLAMYTIFPILLIPIARGRVRKEFESNES